MNRAMRTFVFLAAIAAVTSGCNRKPAPTAAVEAAYHAYEKALESNDVAALKGLVAGDVQAELSGPDTAMKLEMIKAFRPKNPRITSIAISNSAASIKVEGEQQGQKASGEVSMTLTNGAWKLLKEDWTMEMSMGTASANIVSVAPEPFMPDPKKPPVAQVVLEGHQGDISKLAFTPDGSYLVSVGYGDYSLRVWDPASGKQVAEAKLENRPRGMVVTRDGSTVLTADAYLHVMAWPLESGQLGEPRTLLSDAGDEIALSPNGELIAAASYQKPVTIWSNKSGTAVKTLDTTDKIRVLAFAPSGAVLVGAGDGNNYTVWDTKTWKGKSKKVEKVDPNSQATGVAVSPDSKLMAIGFADSSIVVIDLAKGKEIQNFYVTDEATTAVTFSPDGELLVTANREHIYLWGARTAKRLGRLKGHSADIGALAFSPSGSSLASGSADRKIMLWRAGVAPAAAAAAAAPAKAAATATPTTAARPAVAPAPAQKPAAVESGPVLELPGAKNLVRNSSANSGLTGWRKETDAEAGSGAPGNPCFVVKYDGSLLQDVKLDAKAGSYALVVARASSERVEEDGDQTGLPYLYGNWVNSKDPNRFNGYLNADEMTLRGGKSNQWGVVYCIYPVPADTAAIRLSLSLADGGKSQNGSAGRFDDVAVYTAASEAEARRLLDAYRGKAAAFSSSSAPKAVAPAVSAKSKATPAPAKSGKNTAAAPAAAPATAMDAASYVGRPLEEARHDLGFPKMQFKQGNRMVYVYDGREISSSDGVTVDRDEMRR